MSTKPSVESRRRRILIVDDEELMRELFSQTLAAHGCDVDLARDGEEAWDALLHEQYDLLITDNDMPRLGGMQLIKRLRIAGIRLPVMVVSGSLDFSSRGGLADLRITAMLQKPVAGHELIEAVNAVVPLLPGTKKGSIRAVFQVITKARALGTKPEEGQQQRYRSAASSAPPCADPKPRSQRLKASEREPSPDPEPRFQPGNARHNRVLIVDDDPIVRGSLAAVLESEGFLVDEAENGLRAVARARLNTPDLVLLDLSMPEMDGWETFTKIDHIQPLVPVVVITARPHQYKMAVRFGVDAFMEKPLNIPVLVKAIRSLTTEDENRHTRRITDPAFVTHLLDSINS